MAILRSWASMVERAVDIQSEMEALVGFDPGGLIIGCHAEYLFAIIGLCKNYL
jgi:hypothetical protein